MVSKSKGKFKMNFLCQDLSNIYTSTHLHTLTFMPYIQSQVCTPTIALVVRWSREIRVSQKIILYVHNRMYIHSLIHLPLCNIFTPRYVHPRQHSQSGGVGKYFYGVGKQGLVRNEFSNAYSLHNTNKFTLFRIKIKMTEVPRKQEVQVSPE